MMNKTLEVMQAHRRKIQAVLDEVVELEIQEFNLDDYRNLTMSLGALYRNADDMILFYLDNQEN